MKLKLYTYIITACLLSLMNTSCDDMENINDALTCEQKELIGTEIQFDPFVQEFTTTRSAANNYKEGQFNTNDLMYIYRQYYEDGNWVYKTPPGTIYKYTDLTNGATGIFDKTSWKVYENKWFVFQDKSYNGGAEYKKRLTAADSITWETGATVRFRAWVLSRLGNTLADPETNTPGIKSINYPDYMVCDWVTVAGPTKQIPMAMRHLGCRLGFVPREHNVFSKIEITFDPEDYKREDNADTNEHDETDKHPSASEDPNILTAEQCAANVQAVYEKMCWPAGVDMEDMSLKTCSKDDVNTYYTHNSKELTTEFIKNNVKRAEFKSVADDHYYLITIPYDMSNDGDKKGEPLVLPPYTRFRIWLRDVNHGDKNNDSYRENEYHIFSLSDVKKNGETAFPDGITLFPGYSYRFTVGYNYRTLEVTAADNFSWAEQNLADAQAESEMETKPAATDYEWWTSAIETACNGTKEGNLYNPTFSIKNEVELQELINLVNGNFKMGPENGEPELKKAVSIIYNPKTKEETERIVKWYTAVSEPDALGVRDTVWATDEDKKGYIFYKQYKPAIGTTSSVIEEDYLKVPYSFYDEYVGRRFNITLAKDLDLKDWQLECIGNSQEHQFEGNFDGAGHTLTNVYIDGGQLFGFAKNGCIANLKLESSHPLSVTGTCDSERILGCSILAPSKTGTLADIANGTCYFVGCIHIDTGTATTDTKPLVTEGENINMYGCMQAAYGIDGAALANLKQTGISLDSEEYTPIVFAFREDLPVDSVTWTQVSCNYYDTELSPNAKAFRLENGTSYIPSTNTVDGKTVVVPFHRLQYIRGAHTHVLCAKNDYLVDNKTDWMKLSPGRKMEYYGIAPWRAMNFGIYMYNSSVGDDINKCKMHYENTTVGYAHRYPELKSGFPTKPAKGDTTTPNQYENVLQQYN